MPQTASATIPGSGLTIISPPPYRTFRGGPERRADIPISGTCSGSTAAIEASFAGGPFTIIDPNPAGGGFSGVLRGQTAAQGALVVRCVDDRARSATVPCIGIGIVLLGCGQSNGVGQGVNLQEPPAQALTATMLGYDGRWKELRDPLGDTAGSPDAVFTNEVCGGSVWPGVAASLMALHRRPVCIIPGWRNSSGLLAPGPVPAWASSLAPADRSALFGSVVQRVLGAVGRDGVDAVLWWQGEGDAGAGTAESAYVAAFSALTAAFRTALGSTVRVLPAKLQHCDRLPDAAQAAIADAIDRIWREVDGVLPGPDLRAIEADDADRLHLASDAALARAATAWTAAIDRALARR